jgi:hypothetical protein
MPVKSSRYYQAKLEAKVAAGLTWPREVDLMATNSEGLWRMYLNS